MDSSQKKFAHKKSLGQHFLTNAIVPSWMCDAADIQPNDMVLEIGPGTGVLTREILNRQATVVALEADMRAIAVLEETFSAEIASKQLRVLHCDIRTFTIASIEGITDHRFKVVANIPYYLSGLLFRMMLESPIQPSDLVYLVQKEVAKRITADLQRGEKESLLSLSVKAYGIPSYIKTVSRGHFTPPPKVDSAIIAIRNISRAHFENISESMFFSILHLGFGQKRKQLLGNLSKEYPRDVLTTLFSSIGLSASVRAEDVPLPVWLALVSALSVHR